MSKKRTEALAYFLTWTTYGTWLRGDERGYVGKTLAGKGLVVPKLDNPYEPSGS